MNNISKEFITDRLNLMSEELQPIKDHYNQFIKKINYYTSLFIGSLSIIIITPLINQELVFSNYVKLVFLFYLISVLCMILIGIRSWQRVDSIMLKSRLDLLEGNKMLISLETRFKFYDKSKGLEDKASKIKAQLLKFEETTEVQSTLEQINVQLKELSSNRKKEEKEISKIEDQILNHFTSNKPTPLEEYYPALFNWNIFISVFLLATGIVFIILKI